MGSAVCRNDETVTVEAQVDRLAVQMAGLTITVTRTSSGDAPTLSVEVWPAGAWTPTAYRHRPIGVVVVPAPDDDRDSPAAQWYRNR